MGTNDARLIAVDADSGRACDDFGTAGQVHIDAGIRCCGPASSDHVVAGGDRRRRHRRLRDHRQRPRRRAARDVRAFDARTGAPRWTFDPIPQRPRTRDYVAERPAARTGRRTSGARWRSKKRDLVFLPTSSAGPDFCGGVRPGDNRYANSIVALRGATGEVVWHFQTVHHDIWDYDLAAQPNWSRSAERRRHAGARGAATTKTGLVFMLNRETGEPFFPIDERPVPTGDVPGEWLSPTQPFPQKPPPLVPQGITPTKRGALRSSTGARAGRHDRSAPTGSTRRRAARHDREPVAGGGVNWGSAA